ncbi:MAG TPA: hypothetical protein VM597_29015, partial [Gemmataceae bacterium]|nr:hypothetical protein [Gemmataceae bacterium]
APKRKEAPKEDTGPRKLRGHLSGVIGLTPGSGGRVYSIGDDKALRHWVGNESTVLHTFGSPGIGVATVDEGRRVVACDSFAVVVIDPARPGDAKPFESPRGGVRSLAVTADGRTIVTGLSDGFLRTWNVESGKFDEWQVFPRGDVHAVAVDADARLLIAGADGNVALWQLAGQKKLFGWTPHKAGTASLCLSPDGTRAALGGVDGALVVYDLAGRKDVVRTAAHQGAVTAVAWDSPGKLLATTGADGIARLWDAQSGKPSKWTHPLDGRGSCIAFQPRGDRLLVGTVAGAVWDVPLPAEKAAGQMPEINAPPEPLDVPPAEAVQAATEDLRKRAPGPPADTAKVFLAMALGPDVPAAKRFAAFREARLNAARADDVATAVAVARGFGAWFDVDELKELAAGLGSMSGKADRAAFGEAVLEAVEKAESAQRPDVVATFFELAGYARGAPDNVLRGIAAARARAAAVAAELIRVREAAAVLKANPDDPEANATYGAYLCFGRQLWDRGLPYLARGANPAIKAAAKADVTGARDAAGLLRIADGWLAIANGADPRTRTATLARVRVWADRVTAGKPDVATAGKVKTLLEAVAKLETAPGDPAVPFSVPPVAVRRGYNSVDPRVVKSDWV